MKYYVLFFAFLSALHAQQDVTLQNILLTQDEQIAHISDDAHGVILDPSIEAEDLKGKLHNRLAKMLGEELNIQTIDKLKKVIVEYFEQERFLIVSAVVPPQNISNGALQIRLMKGTVGEVTVSNNRWTKAEWIIDKVGIYPKETIRLDKLENNLAWLNRNPFRKINLLLSPGNTAGTTDVELVVKDRLPVNVTLGADNTGTKFTERTRMFAGASVGNLWGQDHRATYQYITTVNPDVFSGHVGSYIAPLPWKHELFVYGGWAKVRADMPTPGLKTEGTNWQVSPRYVIPIHPMYGDITEQITFGYDFKRTNNGILYNTLSLSSTFADINQFMAAYMLNYRVGRLRLLFDLELYGAPCKITHYQTTPDYQAIRPFAKPEYLYGKTMLIGWVDLPANFLFKGSLEGQATAWNLLPSEQFGLGGHDSVRGYQERVYNADDAVLLSAEVFSPSVQWKKKISPAKNDLKFLAFIDYGWGKLHQASVGEKSSEWFLGIGPGVRYSYLTYINLKVDLGFPLHKAGLPTHGPQFHASAIVNF